MNKLVRDPAPRFVPTKFDHDPIRTAPGRAVTVWGNARPPARPPARPAGDDNTPRAQFGLRGKKQLWLCIVYKEQFWQTKLPSSISIKSMIPASDSQKQKIRHNW